MDDPAKVLVAVSFFGSVAYSINAIARAAVAHRKEGAKAERVQRQLSSNTPT